MRFLRASNPVLNKGPFKVACSFLLFSAAWILLTDLLFDTYLNASVGWHISKGLLYVMTSTVILFWLSRRLVVEAQRWQQTLLEIFQQTAFGVCFTDESGRIIDCNQACSEFLGYQIAELVGKSLCDLLDPDGREQAKADIEQLFRQKTLRSYVRKRKFVHKNGKAIWARAVGSRIEPGGREQPFLVVLLQDITTEVAVQEALEFQDLELLRMLSAIRDSESRFRGLAECSLTGIAVASSDGRVLDANGEFLNMLGYTREELDAGGLNWLELTPPEYHAVNLAAIEELKINHHFAPYEKEYIARNGSRIPILISGRWVSQDAAGTAKFVVSVTDLRNARRAEAQLSRLVLAVENAYEAIVISELDGSIVYVNPAFEAMTGYKRTEVLGRSPQFLDSGRTPHGEHDATWSTLRAGKTWSGRFWNRRKDGSEYLEDATISPVRDNRGKIINYLAVKRDITREHWLESRVRQTQKLEAVGQLTGGVAHDLNNVLQVVHSCAELALRRRGDETYTHKKLHDILTASQRGAGIIAQLLAFTRKQNIPTQCVDLNQVVSETCMMLRRLLPENVELLVDLASDMYLMSADPVRISQVLLNLAINSRDAMPDGGMLTISTSMHVEDDERFACLEVKDTGTGMSEATKAKIFEPFFTTKQTGRGTGLGLATVREIVEQTKAKIFVNSEPGKGTSFRIEFPAAPSNAQEDAADQARPGADELEVNGHVLVCEDDATVRTAICDYLAAIGVRVVGCRNADEALAEAAKAPPEILISDVIMPGKNGLQLAQQLRKKHQELKVLLMTGHTEHEILNEIEAQKEICLLQKPFTSVSLVRHLRELSARTSA